MKRAPANKVSLSTDDGLYYCDEEPFTGVSYTEFPDGSPRSESEYRNGLAWGKSKSWHKNGTLFSESEFYRDVLHGVSREWSPAGRLVSEIVAEYGITIRETTWDEQGTLLKEYVLREGHPDYRALLKSRELYDSGKNE